MSGFNAFCQAHIAESLAGGTWERLRNVRALSVTAVNFDVRVEKTSGGNAPTLYWGTSPTFWAWNALMLDLGGDEWRQGVTDLNANTLYYFAIAVGAVGVDGGKTGIYAQRTTA